MSIAGDGYVFVPRCVSDSALRALRSEADHLFRLKKAQDALSEDEYFDKVRRFYIQSMMGCILQKQERALARLSGKTSLTAPNSSTCLHSMANDSNHM